VRLSVALKHALQVDVALRCDRCQCYMVKQLQGTGNREKEYPRSLLDCGPIHERHYAATSEWNGTECHETDGCTTMFITALFHASRPVMKLYPFGSEYKHEAVPFHM